MEREGERERRREEGGRDEGRGEMRERGRWGGEVDEGRQGDGVVVLASRYGMISESTWGRAALKTD